MGTIRYFAVVLSLILFVITYIWQNTEVMKIKLMFNDLMKKEGEIIKLNDRYLYKIERFRRIEVIEASAKVRDFKRISPKDFIVLKQKTSRGKGIK